MDLHDASEYGGLTALALLAIDKSIDFVRERKKKIEEKVEDQEKELEEQKDARLDALEQRFEELARQKDARSDALERKFDALGDRFSAAFDKLGDKISDLQRELGGRITQLTASVAVLEAQQRTLETEVGKLREDKHDLSTQVQALLLASRSKVAP